MFEVQWQWVVSHLSLAVAVAITAFAVIGLLVAEYGCAQGQSRRYIWIFKPLASLGFLDTAIVAGALNSVFGRMILVALSWSAVGDVLLIPEGNKKTFMAGMAAFLLGHLCYCVAFFHLGTSFSDSLLAAAIMVMVSSAVLRWFWPYVNGLMRKMLVAYVAVISVMVVAATGAATARQMSLLIVAAAFFAASDILTARNQFIRSQFINRLVSLPLYYTAQLLFAISVMI